METNNKNLEFYLAHPFQDRKKIRKWELGFEKRTEISLINPFYDVERKDIEKADKGIFIKQDKNYEKFVVQGDLFQIIKAKNGLIAIINNKTKYGTPMEIVYANILKKSVYLVVENGDENHPWLVEHSDKIFTNKKDLEKGFIQMITQNKILKILDEYESIDLKYIKKGYEGK